MGSHALRHVLSSTDWDVVCPVTFTHRGKADRIRLALDDLPDAAGRVHVVKCDLAAPVSPQTDDAFGPIDYVLNFASESHVDRSITHPAAFIQNNVAVVTNLLDWCRTRPAIAGVVHVSTDEVYGPAQRGYAHHEWDTIRPSNPYSASKAAQEAIAFSYWRTYDLPIIITNTMNIVGEMQDPEKFVPMAIRNLLADEAVPVHGRRFEGRWQAGSRFYLHARNQADGVLFALRQALRFAVVQDAATGVDESLRHSMGGAQPFRLHIVGEREVANDEMVAMLADTLGVEPIIQWVDFHSSRPGHDLRYALDGRKMDAWGWKPPVPLDESLRKTVAWTLEHPEWLCG